MRAASSAIVALVAGSIVLATRALEGQSIVVQTVEDRDHVAIMQFAGVYDRQEASNREFEYAVRQAIAKEFFRTHTDDYDFLVVFSRFPFEIGTAADGEVARYYGIKNDTQGIGRQLF